MNRTPNLFIVGVAKGGTTSLYNYLRKHPDVFMCPIKEPNYFLKDRKNKITYFNLKKYLNQNKLTYKPWAHIEDWDTYMELFREAKNQKIIGENSNYYMLSEIALRNIKEKIKNPKIIIVLRNPVERAISHFNQMIYRDRLKTKNFKKEFLKDINDRESDFYDRKLFVEFGLYYEKVKLCFELFGKDNVFILFSEELKNNTEEEMKKIYNFLEVKENIAINYKEKLNKAKIPKFFLINKILNKFLFLKIFIRFLPEKIKLIFNRLLYSDKVYKTQDSDRMFLLKYFKEDILKLSEFLNKDLSGWLK